MSPDRVFIDTNVLVSAIAFDGNEREVVGRAIDGAIKLVFSTFVLRETRRVVAARFPTRVPRLEWVLTILDYELLADPSSELLREASGIVRDPGDVDVLASIMQARPDVALTGDKDLLTEQVRAIAPVCTCADYLGRLEEV